MHRRVYKFPLEVFLCPRTYWKSQLYCKFWCQALISIILATTPFKAAHQSVQTPSSQILWRAPHCRNKAVWYPTRIFCRMVTPLHTRLPSACVIVRAEPTAISSALILTTQKALMDNTAACLNDATPSYPTRTTASFMLACLAVTALAQTPIGTGYVRRMVEWQCQAAASAPRLHVPPQTSLVTLTHCGESKMHRVKHGRYTMAIVYSRTSIDANPVTPT